MDLGFGYTHQPGEEDSYKLQLDAYQKLDPKNQNFTEFKRLLETNELREANKLPKWKSYFGRNTLVDLINSLPELV